MRKLSSFLWLLLSFVCAGALSAQSVGEGVLDRSGWHVDVSSWCTDGSEPNGSPSMITDGDAATYWHSNWTGDGGTGTGGSLPEWITIDMGSVQTFNGIGYMPRAYRFNYHPENGTVSHYRLYVSDSPFTLSEKADAGQLGTPAMEGDFGYGLSASLQIAQSSAQLSGRYLLFVVDASMGNEENLYGSCAEFYVYSDTEAVKAAAAATAREQLQAVWENATAFTGEQLGYKEISTVSLAAARAVLDKADATYDDYMTAAYELSRIVKEAPMSGLNSGEIYRLVSAFDGFETIQGVKKAFYSDGSAPAWTTENLLDPTQYWEVTESDGKYILKNMGDGKYFATPYDMSAETSLPVSITLAAPGIFNLSAYGNNGLHFNDHQEGAGVNGYMAEFGTYGGLTVGASTWHISRASLEEVKSAAEALDEYQVSSQIVGAYTPAKIQQLAAATDLTEALALLRDARTQVKDGGYYRFRNVEWDCYMGLDGSKALGIDEQTNTRADLVWQLVAEDGKYKLLNPTLNLCLGRLAHGTENTTYAIYQLAEAELFTLDFPDGAAKARLRDANGYTMHCEAKENSGNNPFGINQYEAGDRSRWYIVEATGIDVEMTRGVENTYGSAYMPFPVTAPASVSICTGSRVGSTLRLDAVTQTLPARTGVVLVGTDDVVTLSIAASDAPTAEITDNYLEGSLRQLTYIEAELPNYFQLTVEGDNVFFRAAEETPIVFPANSAYIYTYELDGIPTQGLSVVLPGRDGNTMGAPIFSPKDLKEGMTYFVRNVGSSSRRGFVYAGEKDGAKKLLVTEGDEAYNAAAETLGDEYLFTVTGNGVDGFILRSVADPEVTSELVEPGYLILEEKTNTDIYTWNVKTPTSYLNADPGEVVTYWDAEDYNGSWEFYPINTDTVTVVLDLHNSRGSGITRSTYRANVGGHFPTFPTYLTQTSPDFYTIHYPENLYPDGLVTEGCTVEIPYTLNFPFAVNEDGTPFEDLQWNFMTVHADHKYYVHDNGTEDYISLSRQELDLDNIEGDLWAFVGTPFLGFRIYNKAQGSAKLLYSTTDITSENEATTYPVLSSERGEGSDTYHWHFTHGAGPEGDRGVFIAQLNNRSHRMNVRDGKLAYWLGGADAGSTFFITPYSFDAVKGTYEEKIAGLSNHFGDAVNQIPGDIPQDLSSSALAAVSDLEGLKNFKTRLDNTLATAERRTLNPNKYYRLLNVGRDCYMGLDGDSLRGCDENVRQRLDLVWQFAPSGDGVKIFSPNLGRYLNALSSGQTSSTVVGSDFETGGLFKIDFPAGDGRARLMDGNESTMQCEPKTNAANPLGINNWWEGNQARWFLIEATDFERDLTECGQFAYTSLHAPFAVGVPRGFTAYAGQFEAEKMVVTMKEITSATVPAGTGVVIGGSEPVVTLTIGDVDAAPSAVASDLSGTNTALSVEQPYDYRLLDLTGESVVFAAPMAEVVTLDANTAYLLTTEAGVDDVLSVQFEGGTVGLSGAKAEAAATGALYDLTGRRVEKAAKGIYIQNGKKIYVK